MWRQLERHRLRITGGLATGAEPPVLGAQRTRSFWTGIVATSAGLAVLSAVFVIKTVATPPSAPAVASAANSPTPGIPLGLLTVSPEEGAVGTAITVTGHRLPPGKIVDLVWAARVSDGEMPHERFFVGHTITDAGGEFTATVAAMAISNHCELYDIFALVEGQALASGGFRVPGLEGSPLI